MFNYHLKLLELFDVNVAVYRNKEQIQIPYLTYKPLGFITQNTHYSYKQHNKVKINFGP